MSDTSSSSGGIGFVEALTILFFALKLTGFITWSWWWVWSPVWISILIVTFVVLLWLGFQIIFGDK